MKLLVLLLTMLFSGIAYSDSRIPVDPPEADFYYDCGFGDNGEADCDFNITLKPCYGTLGNICYYHWYFDGRGYYGGESPDGSWLSWSYIDPGFYDVILVVTDGFNQSSSVTKRIFAGDPSDNPEIRNMHISGEKRNGVVEVMITYETRFYDGGGLDKFHLVLLDGVPYDKEYNDGTYIDVWEHRRKSAEYTICRRDYPDLCASVYGELQGKIVVEVDK